MIEQIKLWTADCDQCEVGLSINEDNNKFPTFYSDDEALLVVHKKNLVLILKEAGWVIKNKKVICVDCVDTSYWCQSKGKSLAKRKVLRDG